MAEIRIEYDTFTAVLETNDVGATQLLVLFAHAFREAGGAWFDASMPGATVQTTETSWEGRRIYWLPAAATAVAATFDDGPVNSMLDDVAGVIP